ncbi:MAG: beta-ketoacyl synthase N-terminal-like domain-containing protein [Planctomycetaceae bacterium]
MPAEALDPVVVVGMACRLPGCDNISDFEDLLFHGRSAISPMPTTRLDRSLYHNPKRGLAGMTYTDLGGCVVDRAPDPDRLPDGISPETAFDPAHLHFCDVARSAWQHAGLSIGDAAWKDCGVFVGHSGGTARGGELGLATQIEEALTFLNDVPQFAALEIGLRRRLLRNVAGILRQNRPQRSQNNGPQFNAYLAASLAARTLQVNGPRLIVDGACASSLMALDHAIMAIRAGRIGSAIVGGATYNGADNLILFSQSQACSQTGSTPFDDAASGLISSEGYVAVLVTTLSRAVRHNLSVEAVITGIGISSDGRGRSLWAPRQEGQELALRRAYKGRSLLDIDYLEAHATSTQLGDATELKSVGAVAADRDRGEPIRIGSVKSNIGHTLESAGLIGLVKVILSLQRQELAPSINITSLNRAFDWSDGRIRVVTKTESWRPAGAVRRAAVSAFGIGGLNAHLHVEEYSRETTCSTSPDEQSISEPIAIIGRGVVLPGALNVPVFDRLLTTGRSVIADAPQSRWRDAVGVDCTAESAAYCSPTSRGGYITDFVFNAQAYRIPPKQVQQCNPVQMMLLDAVTQAVTECDGGQWSFDRQRTAVVIGTIFGTEFGNQLQVGLRLPEICREIQQQLKTESVNVDSQAVVDEFRRVVLKYRPALLDETGSFTASTLASRIAKTFDLMGGAGAVDADDSSGLAALSIAVDKLRNGQCDTIVCGAAHRAMDLSAFEELRMNGRLVHSGRAEDIPDDCSRILPGEGVVALLLCRYSDAVKNNRTILGTINDVTTGVETVPVSKSPSDPGDARLVQQIGYLSGCQPLVRLVQETLRWQHDISNTGRIQLSSRASDGFAIRINAAAPGDGNETAMTERRELPAESGDRIRSRSEVRTVRIGGATEAEFLSQLETGLADPGGLLTGHGREAFGDADVFRLSMVVDSFEQLAQQLASIRVAWNAGTRRRVFEAEQAVLWQRTSALPRVAWLFPGQGSQYRSQPSVFDSNTDAQRCLAEIDASLVRMGLAELGPQLRDEADRLGKDVWLTQLWVLGTGLALSQSLTAKGLRPDVVLGHSFGEYVAAVSSGVMSVDQALRVIRHRSDAVIMNTRERGTLLSIRGSLNEVDAALRQCGLPITITHNNSPGQTVVAGPETAIQEFRRTLSSIKLAAIVIPVPAPFHTAMLANAEAAMAHAVSGEQLRPPSCGFLSATSGRFLAEPDDIRNSLVTQLTQPVLYQPSVRRLLETGSLILLEVGPNDVLTRLNRDIVPDGALCLSLDVPGQTYAERLALLDLVLDCTGWQNQVSTPPVAFHGSTLRSSAHRRRTAAPTAFPDSVEVVDVTGRRSRRSTETPDVKADSAKQNGHAAESVVTPSANSDSGPAPTESNATGTANANATVRRFLLDLVVELTGYDRDILDFDAHLEADLGLDSIKIAQIVGELAEWAELNVAAGDLRLSNIRTLDDIAALAADIDLPDVEASGNVTPADAATRPTAASVAELLVDFVVDLTGYDREIVDLDADLEAELGLDSIKIAQIVGELQEQFELRSLRADELSLGDFRTLRSIQTFLLKSVSDQTRLQAETQTEVTEPIDETPVVDRQSDSAIFGVEPCDQLPADWAALFQTSGHAEKPDDAWQSGFERGRQHRAEIRAALRLLVDQDACGTMTSASMVAEPRWNEMAEAEMKGLSSGAGVRLESVRFAAAVRENSNGRTVESLEAVSGDKGTQRFALRMLPAPRRSGMPTVPVLYGPALLLGKSDLAMALADRIRSLGQPAFVLSDLQTIEEAESELAEIWTAGPTPHLFLLTSCDDDAVITLDANAWQRRRTRALQIPFRFCQLWMQNVIDAQLMEDASVVAVSKLGGDLGFSGQRVQSPESLAGLVKAMLIESWMREFRTTPMKVVDVAPETPVDLAIDGILHELAVPSYDMEVSVCGSERLSVQAIPAPLPQVSQNGSRHGRSITRGGTWIVSGGGRGITALTAMALAEQHDLHLHLLGTAPVPAVAESMRAAAGNRSQLRRQVMATAIHGENPVELWRNTEKAIEIDATLQECRQRGIRATYHCCDVADIEEVALVLQRIRDTDGPIRGVLHGAGAGQDSRFDRKRPDKVEKCLRAKIDGGLVLMDQTRHDPLEWFVAYGSISGRFGANGHTDYSLANDMLAKLVDRYRSERPDVSSLTFHWHAWGGVGMATKPEARLALEMIDMEFMPAEDGVAHFLREFTSGGDEPEVLITDHNYFRKFFPAERISQQTVELVARTPLLKPLHSPSSLPYQVTLDPVRDRFLSQHRVAGRPTLPFVVALELMAEAARLHSGRNCVVECRDVTALQAIKFATDDAMAVTVDADVVDETWLSCRIQADVRRRDGRLVESDRTYFQGCFRVMEQTLVDSDTLADLSSLTWECICYPDPKAPIYHGPELQGLRKIAVDDQGGWGQIAASAPVQLFGAERTHGWTVPCAAMDACLYAVAVVAWKTHGKASLPVKFGSVRFGRQPDPGEPCVVRVTLNAETGRGVRCCFRLQGLNGDVLLNVEDFEIAWLG